MSQQGQVIAYADGSCLGNPGPGGWGVVLVSSNGSQLEFSGAAGSTTNNRMEITAAIEALRRLPPGFDVVVRTDSQYLVKTMTVGWKRRENLDLWKILDSESAQRKVSWEWVRGHSGDILNERADELARCAALGKTLPARPATSTEIAASQRTTELDGSPAESLTHEPPNSSNQETTGLETDAEIARQLRPLLAADETLRRCASCHRAFVAKGNPARMRAYCSLAPCQLQRRVHSKSG
jgi:ribonuclease HI